MTSVVRGTDVVIKKDGALGDSWEPILECEGKEVPLEQRPEGETEPALGRVGKRLQGEGHGQCQNLIFYSIEERP